MGFRIEGRFVGMILLVMVAACGGGDDGGPAAPVVPPDDNDLQGTLTLLTGWWQDTGGEIASAEIPAGVAGVRLTVTTPGGTVNRDTSLTQDDLRAEFPLTLPAGPVARFTMEAVDAGGDVLYRGVYYHQVIAQADSFFLTMVPASDTTAPNLADDLTVVPRGNRDLEMTWAAATSGQETDLRAAYLVWATPAGQAPAALPSFATGAGETMTMLGDLLPGTSYDLLVRAVDSAGNISDGSARQTVTMPTEGGTLYVDVNTGRDAPDRGGPDDPFKTITYALTRTAGNASIIIRQGTYETETGEVFPLQLKPGIQLHGELQWNPTRPLTRLRVGGTSEAIIGAGWNSLSGLKMVNIRDDLAVAYFIDARESDLRLDFMAFDGNGGYTIDAVAAGQGAHIRSSYFTNLPQGNGVAVFGDDYSLVYDCRFSACGTGVAVWGHNAVIAACRMNDCLWGLIGGPGDDIHIIRSKMSGCEYGLQLDGMSSSVVGGCLILGSDYVGVQLADCASSLRIAECLVQNEDVTGIYVMRGSVTLFQNTLSCNRTNLYVNGPDLVIADHNEWRHNPPDVRTREEGMGPDGFCDISYDADYSGTPEPIWEPNLGMGGCTTFMVIPLYGGVQERDSLPERNLWR